MKNTLLFVFIVCTISLYAQQNFIEKYNLPVYDCDHTNYNKFWTNDVIVVIPDDTTGYMDDAKKIKEDHKGKNINIAIKSESQLERKDFNSNLFVLGIIGQYSNWEKLGIPVSKLSSGFQIENYSFSESLHSFIYVSDLLSGPMRVAYIGNNLQSYKQLFHTTPLGFRFVVKRNTVPVYISNDSVSYDLASFKERHYTVRESKYYTFLLSENLTEEQMKTYNEQVIKYDNHVESFVEKLKLELPTEKIQACIHPDQQGIKYMSGNYTAICYDGIMYGYALNDEIHSWGFSGNTIEHESGHWLINSQINKTTGNFISEGVQMWYMFTTSDEFKQMGIAMANQFASEDLTDIISGKGNFFQGDKYYLISGIFVDYLIEKYGIDKFKELYKFNYDEMFIGFEKVYGEALPKIVEDYRGWLVK